MSVSRISDTGYYTIFGSKKAIVVKKEALDYAIKRLKPASIAFTVPRVGDIYVYTRPGTEKKPDAERPPEIDVRVPRSSIPRKGEQPSNNRPTSVNQKSGGQT